MGEVKRYDPMGYDKMSGYMDETPYGDYVRGEDYDQLKAENERLWTKCQLNDGLANSWAIDALKITAERDTLRKQLDEAKELLEIASCGIAGGNDMERIDAWLEANK